MDKKKKQLILIALLLPLMGYLVYSNIIVGMSKDKKQKPTAPPTESSQPALEALSKTAPPGGDEKKEVSLPPLDKSLARERERISQGPWGRDPFQPEPIKEDPEIITDHESFSLTGTMLGGRGTAIIDGEPIGIGENYRGYRLIEVKETEIKLEKDQQIFILSLPEDKL